MYISYLDGSARPTLADSENYVLASIVLNEQHLNYIDNQIKKIKIGHFPHIPDEQIEIHAKDMLNRHGVFESLSWDRVYSFLDDVFDFISNTTTPIIIHSTLIRKEKIYRKNLDIEIWAYRTLLERLNLYLEIENYQLTKDNSPSQFCIILTDSEGIKKDQDLRVRLIEMLRRGTLYSKLKYLFGEPMFVDSKLRNLSQLVDCVAYCIRKHFRTCTPSIYTTNWERYFALIEPKFHAPFGTYIGYGLKIFP